MMIAKKNLKNIKIQKGETRDSNLFKKFLNMSYKDVLSGFICKQTGTFKDNRRTDLKFNNMLLIYKYSSKFQGKIKLNNRIF